jgi:uncharacterized membrane protein YeaQ/YmgE (transglycosylase-associated protein family)
LTSVLILAIVAMLFIGLIVGAVARFLLPGRDPMGCLGTIVLGIAGSFVGGFLDNLIFAHTLSATHFHRVGFLGSVIGAMVVLLILRLTRGGPKGARRS